MSKPICHVLVPYSTVAACGREPYNNAGFREAVTCKQCKKTEHYKRLPNKPKPRRR